MPIDINTLERLMKERGLTQTRLAERAKVSTKTISRILKGEGNTNKVSLQRIAEALNTTPESLAVPLAGARLLESDKDMKAMNYHRTSFYLTGQTMLNYALVEARYGLSMKAVIDAAPALLTLLAEMSLAERRRRLAAYKVAFNAATAMAPEHLFSALMAGNDFDDACSDEEEALKTHDLSGDSTRWNEHSGRDNETGDLFVNFLRYLSEGIEDEALVVQGEISDFLILHGDLQRLTNGDFWAGFALEHRHARIRHIPAELRGDDRAVERAAWLVTQIPDAARKALEEMLSDGAHGLSALGL